MSTHVESWAWKQRVGSPLRKLILVKLASNADDDGWSWWGQKKLSVECETSRQTVNTHVQALRGLGLVQVFPQVRGDGGRKANKYRLIGPWIAPVKEPDMGVKQGDGLPVGESDTLNSKKEELQAGGSHTRVRSLGSERYEVESNSREGVTYVANLRTDHCSCQAGSGCKHLEAALEEQVRLDSARSAEIRSAIWDALSGFYGVPTKKQEGEHGLAVAEIAEMLTAEHFPDPLRWGDEVRRRHAVLAKAWDDPRRVTRRAFLMNFGMAGRETPGAAALTDADLDQYTKA